MGEVERSTKLSLFFAQIYNQCVTGHWHFLPINIYQKYYFTGITNWSNHFDLFECLFPVAKQELRVFKGISSILHKVQYWTGSQYHETIFNLIYPKQFGGYWD